MVTEVTRIKEAGFHGWDACWKGILLKASASDYQEAEVENYFWHQKSYPWKAQDYKGTWVHMGAAPYLMVGAESAFAGTHFLD